MRPSAPFALLSLCLPLGASLGLGCNDQSLGRFNSAPEATITSHLDGDEALEAYQITVRGSVSDPNHAELDLVATWYLGDEVACEGAAPTEDGITTCALTPLPSADRITLEVQDPDNSAASDAITLSIVPTEAPRASILFPDTAERYYSDQKVTYQATVSDAEDAASDLSVAWKSDIDGELDLDGEPDSSGLVTSSGYLSTGQHAITLTVTDQSGKTGADQVVITVGDPNTAPTCQITSPADGGADAAGTEVTFAGRVGDLDQPADTLGVTWSSSLDSTIGSAMTPTTDGSVSLSWPGLSTGVHTVTMTVTDELDATCTDAITWTVGNVPSVEIDLPASGSVVNHGASTTFQGRATDGEDASTELSILWSSDVDGSLSNAGADSSGQTTFSTSSLSAGNHVITLSATDTTGLPASDTISLVVNQPPGAPTVSISPASPGGDDDLGVVIDSHAVDPDGDGISYSYAWFKNGVEATSWTSTSVDESATAKGEIWRVEVAASDGYATGDVGSAEVTIGNTPPTVSSVTLSPMSVYTNDTVSASVVSYDDDGDSVSLSYSWTVAGSTVSATGSSLSGTTWFDKGDTVAVTVSPNDGEDSGLALSSASLTVLNTPPTAPVVTIEPAEATEGSDDLVCEITTASTDVDGDAVATVIEWEVDGSSFGDATTTTVHGDTISADDTVADEEWTCTATPSDGDDDGPAGSDTVTILSSDIDYSGTWDMGHILSDECALGLISMSVRYWSIDDESPDITLTSTGSSVPGTMSGSFYSDTEFEISRTVAGSCTETYTVVGEFVDEDTLEATLTAGFSGGIYCLDCSTTSWDFTARRD